MKKTVFWLMAFLVGGPLVLRAEVKMPTIFGDHMVLQQEVPVPVWGKAEPGETVKVSFAGKEASATAGADGKWMVKLGPLTASEQGRDLVVRGKNTLTFTDVVVGEVWVCSGQSNMVASNRNLVSKEVAQQKKIRFFIIPTTANINPQDDCPGRWVVASPNPNFDNPYSSVGYYFAVDVQKNRKVPVGMLQTAWGGTAIGSWIPMAALEKSPEHQKLAKEVKASQARLPADLEKYQRETLPAWEEKMKTQPEKDPKAKGGKAPKKPTSPGQDSGKPSAIYGGMVHPIVPYAIRGTIWYQGESNTQNEQASRDYASLMKLLVTGWRDAWGQGKFPFLWVQLPAFTTPRAWVTLRESQTSALSIPNTGMAVTLDLNPTDNLHPPNKSAVGQRLALLALKKAYGEKVQASGPVFQSAQVEGGKIRVKFTETGSGLTVGAPPTAYWKKGEDPTTEKNLLGFEVAGSDGVYTAAKAEIASGGDSVLVWSDTVAQPVIVRYAWANHPKANLYNKEALPAGPFRTDGSPQ